MSTYYIKVTEAGLAALAAAEISGTPVVISQFAVGDGGGAYYEPTGTETVLVNEVWRAAPNKIYIHPNHANWIVVETLIPAAVGGFDIREAGIFTAGGTMIAIGKYPLTSKPAPGSGSEKELYCRLIFVVSNATTVSITIDPALIMATQAYADQVVWDHEQKTDPHPQYATDDDLNDHITDPEAHHGAAVGADLFKYLVYGGI